MHVEISIERLAELRELSGEQPALVEQASCPICGSGEGADIARLEGSLATRSCDRCGHIYRSRRPDDDWYREWYRSSWDTAGRGDSRGRLGAVRDAVRTVRAARDPRSGLGDMLAFCRPAIARGAYVLDVGCGYGGTLRAFAKAGCRTFGLEPSPHRARTARLLGAAVAPIEVERLTRDTFGTEFDLVLTHHVLEHVVDPHEHLRRVAATVPAGGWLYVAVPNADNDFLLQHVFYALHVHLFSRASLELAVRRAGFLPERVAEDHQLRILARRATDGRSESSSASTARQRADAVLFRLLGPHVTDADEHEVRCGWSLLPPGLMAREPYALDWSTDAAPRHERAVSLRVDGPRELPAVFSRAGGNGATPFWVK